jgi:hypothetical protein
MGRTAPNLTSPEDERDNEKMRRAIQNNVPGLLEELMSTHAEQSGIRSEVASDLKAHGVNPDAVSFFHTAGPLLNRNMNVFAAKIGFALHYANNGSVLPETGAVRASWTTNFDMLEGLNPLVRSVIGDPTTLSQGRVHVTDQFQYSFSVADDLYGVYVATFFDSFAVKAFVSTDRRALLAEMLGRHVFVPGDFLTAEGMLAAANNSLRVDSEEDFKRLALAKADAGKGDPGG